jgi:uncharacterized membrane protein YgdD (TMEM256/DUF423 family)
MLRIAGIWGALSVLCGAFGVHLLRSRLSPDLFAVWSTGAQYHVVHAVVLLALALADRASERSFRLPFLLVAAGSVLFSGSLYALALSGIGALGAVTPVGGILLVAGWVSIAFCGRIAKS